MSLRTGYAWRLALGVVLLLPLVFLHPPVASAGPEPEVAVARYCTDLSRNGGFESGTFMNWSTHGAPVVLATGGHTGSHCAQLGGRNNAVDRISQVVTCPFEGDGVSMLLYLYMQTTESGSNADKLWMRWRDSRGDAFSSSWHSSLPGGTWLNISLGGKGGPGACSPGVTYEVELEAITDGTNPTWFLVDDVSISACCVDDPYEPNDSFGAARAASPGSYDLRLCPSGDEDWFRFDATAGQLIFLRLGIKEAGQATVCLVSPQGEEVGCDWDVYPYTATLARTAHTSGSWRARVHDPGYHTAGAPLQLSIEVTDGPTPTASPTPTRTRTPTATIPGTVRRVYLPLVLKGFWSPRPEDCTELLTNGNFESGGLSNWSHWGDITLGAGRSSANGGQLGGTNNAEGELWQTVYVPADADAVTWEFWWRAETASPQPNDYLQVYVESQQVLTPLMLLRAEPPLNEWRHAVVDLSPWAGRWLMVAFQVLADGSVPTTFRVDDVSVRSCHQP